MGEPENFNTERIKFFIEENMSHKSSILSEVAKSQQARPQPPSGVSKSMNQPAPLSRKKEEESMEDLMMK